MPKEYYKTVPLIYFIDDAISIFWAYRYSGALKSWETEKWLKPQGLVRKQFERENLFEPKHRIKAIQYDCNSRDLNQWQDPSSITRRRTHVLQKITWARVITIKRKISLSFSKQEKFLWNLKIMNNLQVHLILYFRCKHFTAHSRGCAVT